MNDLTEFDNEILKDERLLQFVKGLSIVHLARKIAAKEIRASDIKTSEHFEAAIDGMGRDEASAIEFHLERVAPIFSAIRKCLEADSPDSAIVLLFTCIEGQVNVALRILMRIKRFSSKETDTAIQGVDFKSKIDVLLPLLGVTVPERIRQFSNESKIVRNKIVHFKAVPSIYHDAKDEEGDFHLTREAATKFFSRNPVDRLEQDLIHFVNESVACLPEVKAALRVVKKFMI